MAQWAVCMLKPQLRQIPVFSVNLERKRPPCSKAPARRTSSRLGKPWEEHARLRLCRRCWLPFRDGRGAALARVSNGARVISALHS